ncbi:2-keto-4-pentenoate hydratase [Brevibacterium daeguense]|uniref:2-keto-4-pentenoate hydratase n=2 Tax=Brevibacterium daeguense TaxID=909936 RepID=A0ABP8EN83_9MICO
MPVRHIPDMTLEDAYAVQELIIAALESADNPRVGRKIGLTSDAVRAQLGVDQPDFGVLLADMEVPEGESLPWRRLIAPRIEAEIAFVLGADVSDTSPEAVAEAVDYAVPSLEIVDSRIAGWDIGIVDTVADNASNSLFVLGSARRRLSDFSPVAAVMTLRRNGEIVSEGTGADCLGDPLRSLTWVAAQAADHGRPLRAGEVILTGALGPMVPIARGDEFSAEISGLGAVSVRA